MYWSVLAQWRMRKNEEEERRECSGEGGRRKRQELKEVVEEEEEKVKEEEETVEKEGKKNEEEEQKRWECIYYRKTGPGSVSSSVAWEPYGIPLLALISRDIIATGAAIQEILQRILAPMLGNEDIQSFSKYCPRCKEQRQASKKLDLWRLPEVLVIHLKRFSFSRSTKHKLETFVNFPIHDLDLTNYVAHKKGSPQIYELYALSNHYGSMASGHYTAHIKVTFSPNLCNKQQRLLYFVFLVQLLDENRWYNFDDSHISPINEEDVKSAAAYVLFYRRTKGEDASTNIGAEPYANKNHNFSKR
ncbi:hypothetical protein GW17_00000060 [Ensete ventricosum]|nr:hypothetical protein GW17_00000060 [Ensete ventricosum]